MKRSSEPGKIYYDVTIDHDVAHKEKTYNFASKAITEVSLRDPLIENPGDYNVVVSKFKIDTEAVPLMIPELAQAQKLDRIVNEKDF